MDWSEGTTEPRGTCHKIRISLKNNSLLFFLKMKKISKTLLSVAALFSALSFQAQADEITSSDSTGRATSITFSKSFGGTLDVTNQLLAVSKFNPGMGTLLSATFDMSAGMMSSAFAVNDGDFFVGWDKLQFSLVLQGDTPYSNLFINAGNPAQRLVGRGTADGSFSPSELQRVIMGGNPSYWVYNAPILTAEQSFTQGALASFIGEGDLSFFLSSVNQDMLTVSGAQTSGSPVFSMGLQNQLFSEVSVTYVYTPVPEPETYYLLFAGVGLTVFAVRRRKQRQTA